MGIIRALIFMLGCTLGFVGGYSLSINLFLSVFTTVIGVMLSFFALAVELENDP